MVKVQVQIIVPLATKSAVIEQKIPVAIGLVQGPVPNVFSSGEGGMGPPSIQFRSRLSQKIEEDLERYRVFCYDNIVKKISIG